MYVCLDMDIAVQCAWLCVCLAGLLNPIGYFIRSLASTTLVFDLVVVRIVQHLQMSQWQVLPCMHLMCPRCQNQKCEHNYCQSPWLPCSIKTTLSHSSIITYSTHGPFLLLPPSVHWLACCIITCEGAIFQVVRPPRVLLWKWPPFVRGGGWSTLKFGSHQKSFYYDGASMFLQGP